jgi:hypothetical protein
MAELLALKTFLNKTRTEDNDWTHLVMGIPGSGKFKVEDEKTLWSLIHAVADKGENYPLLERRKATSPLLIDIDLKWQFEEPQPSRCLTIDKHIKPFITKVAETYQADYTAPQTLNFIVSMRAKPYKATLESGDVWKDGCHIICPELVAKPSNHIRVRNQLVDELCGWKFPAGVRPEGCADEWWDETVVLENRNNWFPLGFGKAGLPDNYEIVASLRWDGNGLTDFVWDDARKLREMCSLRLNLAPAVQMKPELAERLLEEAMSETQQTGVSGRSKRSKVKGSGNTDPLKSPVYLKMKEEHEKGCLKIMSPVGFNVLIPGTGWTMLSRDKLTTLYENKRISDTSFIGLWVKDATMLTKTRFGFYPDKTKCPENVFNEFDGWAYQAHAAEPEPCPDLLWLLRQICGDEEEAYNYVLNWMGDIIQNPERKPGICLVFGGQQGTGKDFFWDWFRTKILGEFVSMMTAQPSIDLFGTFTTKIKNKVLIKIEEGEGKDFHGNSEVFKSMITALTTTYHPKNIDPTEIASLARFVISTNGFNTVKVESEDRRYAFFKAHPHAHTQDREWFADLYKKINQPGVIRWFAELLSKRDLIPWDAINHRPKTLQWKLMRTMSLPFQFRFLEWCAFENGFEAGGHIQESNQPLEIRGSEFYALFNKWTKQENLGLNVSGTKFACLITDSQVDGIVKARDASGAVYRFEPKHIRKWLVRKNYLANEANAKIDADGNSLWLGED